MKKIHWLVSRSRTKPPSTIVLHATAGGSAASSIEWLQKIGLSYHYLIDRDGTVFKCVPTTRVAFHAGVSDGPAGLYVNSYSIGIAFANRNDGEKIAVAQIAACKQLIADLARATPTLRYLTTHYAITVRPDGHARKTDPVGFDHLNEVRGRLQLWKPVWAKGYVK